MTTSLRLNLSSSASRMSPDSDMMDEPLIDVKFTNNIRTLHRIEIERNRWPFSRRCMYAQAIKHRKNLEAEWKNDGDIYSPKPVAPYASPNLVANPDPELNQIASLNLNDNSSHKKQIQFSPDPPIVIEIPRWNYTNSEDDKDMKEEYTENTDFPD